MTSIYMNDKSDVQGNSVQRKAYTQALVSRMRGFNACRSTEVKPLLIEIDLLTPFLAAPCLQPCPSYAGHSSSLLA